MALDPEMLVIAQHVARRLMDEGMDAVILSGSHVRGEAHPESDVDLYALGSGSAYRLERHSAYLVSISCRTPEEVRAAFHSPGDVGAAVPGWREAVTLADPHGVADELKREAEAWTWNTVGEQHCDVYVADWLAGLAEEVHKLVVARERGQIWTAAVQRSVLALRLAPLLALHHRLLYSSENRLWDLVAERMGQSWRDLQGRAFGDNCQSFEETCLAALELYALAAETVWRLLAPDQRAVVAHACHIAGTELPCKP